MSKGNAKTKQVAVAAGTTNLVTLKPDTVPDYLKDQKSDMGLLDSSDYKIPYVKLLQPMSPECTSFAGQALPHTFWHSGANISLGKEFKFIISVISKRVMVWSPRKSGGELLAFSADGKTWYTGGNTKHEVHLDGKKKVYWDTKSDVASSRLLEWGTSDPSDPKSVPAATKIYQYLMYLPDRPELSPCILGVYRTAIHNAQRLNTNLLMIRKPVSSKLVHCFADMQQKDGDTWSVPNFKLLPGFVPKEDYDMATELAAQYKTYSEAQTPDAEDEKHTVKGSMEKLIDDEIPF